MDFRRSNMLHPLRLFRQNLRLSANLPKESLCVDFRLNKPVHNILRNIVVVITKIYISSNVVAVREFQTQLRFTSNVLKIIDFVQRCRLEKIRHFEKVNL